MTTQPESKLSRKIIKLWKARGGYAWKVWGNELTPSGTPDICGVYRGLFVACETKMPGNDLSAIQEYRISRMRIAGALIVAPCYDADVAVAMLADIDLFLDPTLDEFAKRAAAETLRRTYGSLALFPPVKR